MVGREARDDEGEQDVNPREVAWRSGGELCRVNIGFGPRLIEGIEERIRFGVLLTQFEGQVAPGQLVTSPVASVYS